LGALAGAALELVEARHGVIKRRGAEQDGNRIGLSLFVEGPQMVAQEALGCLEVARDDRDLLLDTVPLEPEAVRAAPQARQLASGLEKARIKGVEAQKGRMGAAGQSRPLLARRRLGSLLRACALSPREKDSQEQRGSERQPEREAALPRPTQGL